MEPGMDPGTESNMDPGTDSGMDPGTYPVYKGFPRPMFNAFERGGAESSAMFPFRFRRARLEGNHSFVSLLIILGLAFIVPLTLSRFRRFRIPIVVGEITAGIVVGRSGFALVSMEDPVLSLLAELGFVFLMFLSGMEIDFSRLRPAGAAGGGGGRNRWSPLSMGAINFGLTLAMSLALGFAMARTGLAENAMMLALILSTTSLGVVMPVLKENGLTGGIFGQTVMVTAMVADFATMFLITILVATLSDVRNYEILLISLLFVAFFVIYHFGMLFFVRIPGLRRAMDELSHASTQIKVRAAFTIMLVFVALSEALGAEMILGAFLAGAVISLLRTPQDEALGQKLEAIGFGFFIPIFFITVGVSFNLSALLSSTEAMLLVPVLLGAAVVVKIVPAAAFRLLFSWRQSAAAGALLTARLSLIIAASAIGLRLGLISESVNAAIILVAAMTVMLAPIAFNRLIPAREDMEAPIIVASTGELGLQVAERLKVHGEPVVVVDSDEEHVEMARRRGLEAVMGHMDRPDPGVAPFLERAKAVICTSSHADHNIRVCSLVKSTYGIGHVVVQVNDPRHRSRFEQMGVRTLNPVMDRVAMFALLGRNPALYQLITRTDDDKEVAEVVMGNTSFTNMPLRKLSLPGDLLVLALRRRNELPVPQGNTQPSLGDQLTLVGSVESVRTARELLSGRSAA